MTRPFQLPSNPPRLAEGGQAWPKLAVFLVAGYLCMGKPFAYLGLPWISLFLGEMVLIAFLLFGPRMKQGRWLGFVRRVQKLRRLKWLLVLSLFYGGVEALRGILQGYPVLTAARDTAFNYYPFFLLIGIWVGLEGGGFFRRVVKILALWGGCYGLAYILFLNWIPWTMPGTDGRVSVFLGPYSA